LDVPLVQTLDLHFYEEYYHPRQLQPAQKSKDDSLRRYGTGSLLPTWVGRPEVPYSPLFSYKFKATREALYRLTDLQPDPFDGYALRYVNPFSGGPVMPTIATKLQLLTRGLQTQARRETSTTIYHVAQGSGHSVLEGQRFEWQHGDTFCVPAWCWSEHAADGEDAILFAASDEPAVQSLGLYREQTQSGHQSVTGTFDGRRPQP
jgi:gentisate 1,2-dioxygenase